MKRIAQIVPFLIILSTYGQSSFIKWIDSPKNDMLGILEYLDNEELYFYSYVMGYSDGGSEYNIYFNYSKYYFTADEGFTNIDSIVLDTSGTYLLSSLRLLAENTEEMILYGTALDPDTYDVQLYIVWLDTELNMIKDSIYGLPGRDDLMAGYLTNHNDNVIFWRTYPLGEEMEIVLWEFDLEGNEIAYKVDTLPYFPLRGGFDMTEKNRYQFQASGDVAIFDYDLNYDTSYSWWEERFSFEGVKKIDSSRYFLIGYYNNNWPPFYYEDIDLAFMIMDDDINYYNLQFYGALDTNEYHTRFDFHTIDTLFIGGYKKVQPGPYDSWVTVYKTNLNGDVLFYKNFGGYGYYYMDALLATPDGGCIAGCRFWDFYENPDSPIYDIVLLKFDSNGGLVTSTQENTPPILISDFSIFPNPGSDCLNVISAKENLQIHLFDFSGKLVLEKGFDKSVSLNTNQLPKGVYSYQILQNNILLENGKWVKE